MDIELSVRPTGRSGPDCDSRSCKSGGNERPKSFFHNEDLIKEKDIRLLDKVVLKRRETSSRRSSTSRRTADGRRKRIQHAEGMPGMRKRRKRAEAKCMANTLVNALYGEREVSSDELLAIMAIELEEYSRQQTVDSGSTSSPTSDGP